MKSMVTLVLTLIVVMGDRVAYSQVKGLEDRLAEIMKQPVEGVRDLERLEEDSLLLLEQFKSSEDQGKVYTAIAFMYTLKGMVRPLRTAEYCEKALEHPLDLLKACQLYIYWGEGLEGEHHSSSDSSQFIAARSKIVIPYLKGLKLVAANQKTNEKRSLPVVWKYHYVGPEDDPAYLKMRQRHADQITTRNEIMVQNELIEFRKLMIQKCVSLYSQRPSQAEELRRLSRIVTDSVDLSEELAAALGAQLNR